MALFDVSRLPTEIVVRPSGIWNTRAPFHTFLKVHKGQSRAYDLTTLCLERVGWDLPRAREDGKTLEEFLVVDKSNRSQRAWRNYSKAQTERNLQGELKKPIYSNTRHDLIMAHESLKRSALAFTFSLFEAYVNCWLLNYLLYKLETEQEWSKIEREFAKQVSPVHGSKTTPNLAKIIPSIPALKNALASLSHDGIELFAGEQSAVEFTCFDAIKFWRQYRNCLVHNGGFCTPKFFEQQEQYWLKCMQPFARDKFEERKPLPLSTELLQNCRVTIYKSARALEKSLEEMSEGKRGQPWAPEPRPAEDTLPPNASPAMLLDGDHSLSLKWHKNENYRQQFKLQG